VTCTSADAVETAHRHAATPRIAVNMVFMVLKPVYARQFLAEIINHLRQDLVELKRRLVTDEPFDPRQVRDAARHVLET
jgi:hypothetical protein